MAMRRALRLKWDAFKKGIPRNVSCCNPTYSTYLKKKKPTNASSYVKKTYKKLQVLQMQTKTTLKKHAR